MNLSDEACRGPEPNNRMTPTYDSLCKRIARSLDGEWRNTERRRRVSSTQQRDFMKAELIGAHVFVLQT